MEVLSYDPLTGVFRWRIKPNRRIRIGDIAGCVVLERGLYRRVNIKVDGVLYKAHRLAWMYVHGRFPRFEIDHIDRDATNNSISNLRECTHKQNNENKGVTRRNTSGHVGVRWVEKSSRWVAMIGHNKESIFIGQYQKLEDACAAYEAKRNELFTHHRSPSITQGEEQ